MTCRNCKTGLQSSEILACQRCKQILCEKCMASHDETCTNDVSPPANGCVKRDAGSVEIFCLSHSDNQLLFYCNDCHNVYCEKCDHFSTNHMCYELNYLAKTPHLCKNAIEVLLQNLRQRLEPESDSMQSFLSTVDVKKSFGVLKTLLGRFDQSSSLKSRVCESEQSLNATEISIPKLAQVLNCLEEINLVLDQYLIKFTPPSFPAVFAAICNCLYSLTALLTPSTPLQTTTTVDVRIDGENAKFCCVDRPASINIYTRNCQKEPVWIDVRALEVNIMSHKGTVLQSLSASQTQLPGSCTVAYSLSREGSFLLQVKLYGVQVPGSPFPIRALSPDQYYGTAPVAAPASLCSIYSAKSKRSCSSTRSTSDRTRSAKSKSVGSNSLFSHPVIEEDLVLKVGTKGRARGQFTNPQGVACCSDGRVAVTDSNNQCVQLFTPDGECYLRFGAPGRKAGSVQRPTGVTFTDNGSMLIADYDNKWISLFSPEGKFRSRFGMNKLLGPKGVGIIENREIVVIDNKANQMVFFEPSGKFIRKVGTSVRSRPWYFAGPHYVAIDESRGCMYVSDFHNHAVKQFTLEGTFLKEFGSNGVGNGQFNAPTGIAVDSDHRVLVADWGNCRIQVFDSDGSFMSYISSAHGLYGPQGIAVTPEDHVLVADSGNHCYRVYKYFT